VIEGSLFVGAGKALPRALKRRDERRKPARPVETRIFPGGTALVG
jgi:hypothetical protein